MSEKVDIGFAQLRYSVKENFYDLFEKGLCGADAYGRFH